MDRWFLDAKSLESAMDEKYKQMTRDIVKDIISNAQNFLIIRETLRWCELFQKSKEKMFKSEDDIWVGCPVKDKILAFELSVWKDGYNYITIEFEDFMSVFCKLAPLKLKKALTGEY